MGTYEGICRYCGSARTVMAESKEEADRLITENCACETGELKRKQERLLQNIEEICTENGNMRAMSEEEIQAVQQIAGWIFMQTIAGITINMDHSSIRIWESGEKIKAKRTAKVEETREA